jgi:hypothetical protein
VPIDALFASPFGALFIFAARIVDVSWHGGVQMAEALR